MTLPSPIGWTPAGAVRILDQTLLPDEERYLELGSADEMAEAIRSLRVRGAPLIGIAAAMGVAAEAVRWGSAVEGPDAAEEVGRVCARLGASRPTAVNLHWALRRMERRARVAAESGEAMAVALRAEADAVWDEDRAMCDRIGVFGAELIPEGGTVATICNAGVLATGGIGTALAPYYILQRQGLPLHVIVPETRPLLQGSRLTAWELTRAGVPVTLIGDGMIASRLRRGDVRAVFVGADRIAANGDVANKIGTYGLALAARTHGVPFYVAAPSSTIDLATADGTGIPIEERSADEVASWRGQRTAPDGVGVWNPAFDVTPAALVTAFVTDRGVLTPSELARTGD